MFKYGNKLEEIIKIKIIINFDSNILMKKSNDNYIFVEDYLKDNESLTLSVKRIIKEKLNLNISENKINYVMNINHMNYSKLNKEKDIVSKTYYFEVKSNKIELEKNYTTINITEIEQFLLENNNNNSLRKSILNENINAIKIYRKMLEE